MHALLLLVLLQAAPGAEPLRSGCSPDDPQIASVSPGDRVEVETALAGDEKLDSYSGYVEDSGEGRWTLQAAIDEAVPAEVLSAALYVRFRSRKEHTFAEKIISAMRKGFGGHVEPKKS